MAIKCMCKQQDIYSSSSGLETRLALVHVRTITKTTCMNIQEAFEILTLTRAENGTTKRMATCELSVPWQNDVGVLPQENKNRKKS